jgi:hypothetical protein
MIKILSLHISKDIQLVLGTCVEILAILNGIADSVKITVADPCNNALVDEVTMTKLSNTVYSYSYQSASTNLEGNYIVTISVTSGVNTAVKQESFVLEEQEIN